MAVFTNGVKSGKFDFRVGLSQKRGRGILRKLGILDEKKPTRVKSQGGEIDLIRTIVGRGEGFQMPSISKFVLIVLEELPPKCIWYIIKGKTKWIGTQISFVK